MKLKSYNFHGVVPIDEIGKELRKIVKTSTKNFKIITGYGSRCGKCKSKTMAIKVLHNMKKEGLIKAFLPAEVFKEVLWSNNEFYEEKQLYKKTVSQDYDAIIGNSGVIFIFIN